MVFAVLTGPLGSIYYAIEALSQPILYGISLLAVFLLAFRGKRIDRVISFFLALLWAWMGLYFWREVLDQKAPATWLGLLFLIQALVFFVEGTCRGRLDFRSRAGAAPVLGALFLLYSLVLQPVLELALEPDPFHLPTLDLRFDAVLLTFGLLLFLKQGFPRYILGLPLLWAAIGGMATFQENGTRDWGLVAALLAGVSLILPRSERFFDAERNLRLETWSEYAARHHRTSGRAMLALLLATCLLGFVAAMTRESGKPIHLLICQLEISATLLTALALGLWLSLPAWYSTGFRLLAWEATRGLSAAQRVWNWLTEHWTGVLLLTVVTLSAVLKAYVLYDPGDSAAWKALVAGGLAIALLYAIYRARRRIVIAEFSDYTQDTDLKGCATGVASRLRQQIASITSLYRTIDEAMPEKGEVARVTVGVQDVLESLGDVIGPDSSAQVGSVKIPVGLFLRGIGRLVRGPRLTGSLHKRGDEILLVADLAGGSYPESSWQVSFKDLVEEERTSKTAVVYSLADQLAYRIITSLRELGSKRWEAVRSFTEGLRAYRATKGSKGDVSPELRRAEREFITALSVDQNFSQCHYNLGVVYQSLRSWDSAKASFRQILEENPDWSEAYYALATVHFDDGQMDQAVRFARTMIEIEPYDPRPWDLAGVAMYLQISGRAQPEALHKDRAFGDMVRCFEIGTAMAWRALCAAAVRGPGRSLAKERQLAVGCAANLGIAKGMDCDTEGLRDTLRQAFRLSPRDARGRFVCAASLSEEQRWEESRTELGQVFEYGLTLDDRTELCLYQVGVSLAMLDLTRSADDEEAIWRAYSSFLDESVPQETRVLARRWDEAAKEQWKQSYARHLDHHKSILEQLPARLKLAREPFKSLKLGREPFSSLLRLVEFLRALELGKEASPGLDSLAPYERGWAQAQVHIRTARQDLELEREPVRAQKELGEAMTLLAKNHSRQIHRQGLKSLVAKACLLELDNSRSLEESRKLLRKAIEHAEAAVAEEPGSASRRWILADAYSALGDFEEACNEREIALNLGSSCEVLDDPRALSRIARDYLRLAGLPAQPAPEPRLRRGLKFFKRILQFVEGRKSNRSDAHFAAHAAAHFWVGRFHCELEEHEEGINHLLIARSMTFRPIEIGLRLGNVYSSKRSYWEAEAAFVESLQAAKQLASQKDTPLADEAPGELEAELLLSHAMLLAGRDVRLPSAELLCGQASEGIDLLREERRQELRTLYHECHGWTLFRQGKLKRGAKELELAADAAGTARIYTRLAQVYEAQGGQVALQKARKAREQAKAGNGFASVRVQGVFDLWVEPPQPGV